MPFITRVAANPAKLALCLAIPFGLAVSLITPPFQGMDEANHLARGYQLLGGKLIPDTHEDKLGGFLPRSFPDSIAPYKRFYYNLEAKYDPAEHDRVMDMSLLPDDTVFMEFWNTAPYSPVVYLPHFPGIVLARLVGQPPAVMLYAARLSGLIAYVLLLVLAIRLIPLGKWTMLLVGLMPVPFFVGAVMNADLITNAIAFIFIALCLKHAMAKTREPISSREFAILCLLGVSLTLAKLAYLPMLSMLLMIPAHRVAPSGRIQLQRYAIFAILCLVAFVVWTAVTLSVHNHANPLVNAPEQAKFMLTNPLEFAGVVLRTLSQRSVSILFNGVGALGYLETTIPFLHFIGYMFLLLFAALVDGGSEAELPARCRFWLALPAIGTLAFMTCLIYVNSTPVGSATIPDLSGRYMIPMLPALMLACYSQLFVATRPRLHRYAFALCLLLSMISMTATIYMRYY
jgi:uncharacterized membrane protein